MTTPTFHVGDRVEFDSKTGNRVFRGQVRKLLPDGFVSFQGDGDKSEQFVSEHRLRPATSRYVSVTGGDAA